MKIFLSYAAEDRERAEEIQLALVSQGHQVFFDKTSLLASGDYHSKIQRAVQQSNIFVFLISQHSIVQGNYTLTELKYARDKWPHPKDRVIPVILDVTPLDVIPAYLRSVVVLRPEGNAAAEVAAAAQSLGRRHGIGSRRVKIGVAIISLAAGLAVALLPNRPEDTLPTPPAGSAVAPLNLQSLREVAARFGAREYIADGETVPITAYPSLVDVSVLPDGKVPTGQSVSLSPGMSLDLRFKDSVVGFGIFYKQGLYPSNFNIYFSNGTQKVLTGKGYYPDTGFVAEASGDRIERLIIQPQAHGTLRLTGIYLFAKGQHERVLK